MPGMTVDDGAVWLHQLNLLDAVLQRDDDGAFIAQPGQPPGRVGVLGRFDREQHHRDRLGDVGGIGAYRARDHDRIGTIGPQFDPRSRCSPADQYAVAGGG